jgi:hypothetical protein
VSGILSTSVGTRVMTQRVTKQFVGLVISFLLDEDGFLLVRSGVRLRADAVFGTGSIYRRRVAESHPVNSRPLLQRLLDSLTPQEREWTAQYLAEIDRRPLVNNDPNDTNGENS